MNPAASPAPAQNRSETTATTPAIAPGDQAAEGTPGTGETVCPGCGGSGKTAQGMCPECQGTGKVIVGIGGG